MNAIKFQLPYKWSALSKNVIVFWSALQAIAPIQDYNQNIPFMSK